jgi:hypothetical protein
MKVPQVLVALMVLGGAVAGAAEPDVTVRTSIDRTAIWVADRLTYTVELACRRGIDVLADDLSRDKLKTEGLEVIGSETDRRSAPDGATIYRFQYVLTTYRTDAQTLKIAPLTVRYAVKRAGGRLEDAAPAGEVPVPGATVVLRSVLPDDQDPSGIRSDKPPDERPLRFTALQPIGIGLVIVSAVPALLAIAALVRRSHRPRVRRSSRAARHDTRASLEAVRTMDVATPEARREVFTRLDTLVREHLRDSCGVAAASLTPHEVPFALATTSTSTPATLVADVLATCEVARYAPAHDIPSADACRQAIDRVDQIVQA